MKLLKGESCMKKNTGAVNCFIATALICIVAEALGPLQFTVFGIPVKIMTMIWAIILGMALSPQLLGKVIPAVKNFISEKEIKIAPMLLSLTLYPLGIMFGISAGPQVGIVLKAGPALLLQEAGNAMTMLIALPLGVLLGLGRSAVGGTFSLCRDTALGIIGDKYGLDSREGMGTLGTYISGSVFGAIVFSLLVPIGLGIGLHPYALAMASGMGSGSMMSAATAALTDAASPIFTEQILAYSATSGMITAVTGIYVEMFVALPLANFYYSKVAPPIERFRAKFSKKKENDANVA